MISLPIASHRRCAGRWRCSASRLRRHSTVGRRAADLRGVTAVDQLLNAASDNPTDGRPSARATAVRQLGRAATPEVKLLSQGKVAKIFETADQRRQLGQEGFQVLNDAFQGHAGRLHAKQQAGLPVYLSDCR